MAARVFYKESDVESQKETSRHRNHSVGSLLNIKLILRVCHETSQAVADATVHTSAKLSSSIIKRQDKMVGFHALHDLSLIDAPLSIGLGVGVLFSLSRSYSASSERVFYFCRNPWLRSKASASLGLRSKVTPALLGFRAANPTDD